MNLGSTFQLKVWYEADEGTCFFALFWQEGSKSMVVSQKFPQLLQRYYQTWLQRYLKYYQFIPSQSAAKSGSLGLTASGDKFQDLREAESQFLQTFQRWLGEGNSRQIERKIQAELTRQLHQTSKNQVQVGNSPKVHILLACSSELEKLPWEAWGRWLLPDGVMSGTIRLQRTVLDDSRTDRVVNQPSSSRSPRILTIIGNDPLLPLAEDWKIIKESLGNHCSSATGEMAGRRQL